MSIITLETYKATLGITSPNLDDKLQPLIDMVNGYIPLYCNTSFVTVFVPGARLSHFGTTIILPHAPITSVTGVSILRSVGVTEIISPSDYEIDYEEGTIDLLDYAGILPTKPRSFIVDYIYGFANTLPSHCSSVRTSKTLRKT